MDAAGERAGAGSESGDAAEVGQVGAGVDRKEWRGVGSVGLHRAADQRHEQGWTERAGGAEMSGVRRLSMERADASGGRKKIVLKKISLFIQ